MKKIITLAFTLTAITISTLTANDLLQKRMTFEQVIDLTPYLYKDITNLQNKVKKLEEEIAALKARNNAPMYNNYNPNPYNQNAVVEPIRQQHYFKPLKYRISNDTVFSYAIAKEDPQYVKNIYSLGDVLTISIPHDNSASWIKVNENEFIKASYLTQVGE